MTTTKKPFKLSANSTVTGKWHKQPYFIRKELGSGAIGTVYLAKSSSRLVAIKFSENSSTIATEVNVLKTLAKVQGSSLGPRLLDVDDLEWENKIVPFYVMEFIDGDNFLQFVKKNGTDWVLHLAIQLLDNLDKLHKEGWIFGDLKPDNLIVQYPDGDIRFVDVGGTTKKGRAIKEFTEFFDRGYWAMGGRKAEETYDIFAVAMIILNGFTGKRFTRKTGGMRQLEMIIRQNPDASRIEHILKRALLGKYQYANEMKQELIPLARKYAGKMKSLRISRSNRAKKNLLGKRSKFKEVVLLSFVVAVVYLFYLFGTGVYLFDK